VQERRGGELSSAWGRAAEGREEGERERKKKMEKEKGKWKMKKKKKKGKREKRERERFAPALIAATTAGPVGQAQRTRARADETTGKGVGGLEIGRLEQRNFPRIRVQGFRRILSSTMKSFWKKKYFSA
jgi:hypothetical protein